MRVETVRLIVEQVQGNDAIRHRRKALASTADSQPKIGTGQEPVYATGWNFCGCLSTMELDITFENSEKMACSWYRTCTPEHISILCSVTPYDNEAKEQNTSTYLLLVFWPKGPFVMFN
jgi:hypothetical protein